MSILHYNNDDMLYLLLNLISHDVIHDYGPSSTDRWETVQAIIKTFTKEYHMCPFPICSGGGKRHLESMTQTMTETLPSPTIRPTPSRHLEPTSLRQLGPYIPELKPKSGFNYDLYISMLDKIKNQINNTIIFTFFNHYFIGLKQNSVIDFLNTDVFIIPNIDNSDYKNVFLDISNKFIGFCFINEVNQFLDYNEYLDKLCYFLSDDLVIKTVIFQNIGVDDTTSISKRQKIGGKKKIKGGDNDVELNAAQAQELLDRINALKEDKEVVELLEHLSQIYATYISDVITETDRKLYEDLKHILIDKYKQIFLEYRQINKANALDKHIDIIPLIKERVMNRNVIDLVHQFFKIIDITVLDYVKFIKDIKEKAIILENKRLRDEKAQLEGKLTSFDKQAIHNFTTFIARAGLFLTNICTKDGTVLESYNRLPRDGSSFLRKQINILLYLAEWNHNEGWNDVTNQDLDNELLSFFQQNTKHMEEPYICNRVPCYIVNNAATITPDLKVKTFCPYTSVMDGMSQCSWKTAQGRLEFGNMDFKICNQHLDLFYDGKLTIDDDENKQNFNLSYIIRPSALIRIEGNKRIDIHKNELTAHVVLKDTLLNIMDYIFKLEDSIKSKILSSDDMFSDMFDIFTTTPDLFNIVFSKILFKETGDFFQEINCVCKNGGYVKETYNVNSSDILPYFIGNKYEYGNQLRFFTANDRPSGTRFIFMLKNGNPSEVNLKAFGGYYSLDNKLIYIRDATVNKCLAIRGGRKTRKKKYNSHKKRKTKYI